MTGRAIAMVIPVLLILTIFMWYDMSALFPPSSPARPQLKLIEGETLVDGIKIGYFGDEYFTWTLRGSENSTPLRLVSAYSDGTLSRDKSELSFVFSIDVCAQVGRLVVAMDYTVKPIREASEELASIVEHARLIAQEAGLERIGEELEGLQNSLVTTAGTWTATADAFTALRPAAEALMSGPTETTCSVFLGGLIPSILLPQVERFSLMAFLMIRGVELAGGTVGDWASAIYESLGTLSLDLLASTYGQFEALRTLENLDRRVL